MNKKSTAKNYHHGNLRQTLINKATEQISLNGVDSLSMRKLGELAGVSRTALYHHFSNKSDLLSAIAESGFQEWQSQTEHVLAQTYDNKRELLNAYVQSYITYALKNAAKYDLMFGGEIWAQEKSSRTLQEIAYKCFEFHVSQIALWQKEGIIASPRPALRIAQISWGALHGLSKLFIDGIYLENKNLEELSDTLVDLLTE